MFSKIVINTRAVKSGQGKDSVLCLTTLRSKSRPPDNKMCKMVWGF